MGIVSEPGGRGKEFVTIGQGGGSPTPGWTRGHWERPDPPEGREIATGGTGRRSSGYGGAQNRLLGGLLRASSRGFPHRDGEGPRAQEADDVCAPHAAHRAPREVHAGQSQDQGGHGLGF